jgi:signal recognition particle subunit SRP54
VSDLEPFHPERMASRILGLGDVLTLIEKAQSGIDERKAKEMEERLMSGRLTMEDWLGQMRQLRSMGPLESVLGMLPGMGKQMRQLGNQMPTEKDLSHLEAIVLSMTPEERRRPEIIKGARRKRIALGSGTQISEVNRMLKGFDQMQHLFKQIGGGGKGSKGVRGKMRMLKNLQGLDPTQLGGL